MTHSCRAVLCGCFLVLVGGLTPLEASGQWPMGKTGFWTKISYFHHETETQFRSDAKEHPFISADAKSVSSAYFLDALYGVTDHLDIWAQVPFFDLKFDDIADERSASGFGDIRLMARYHLVSLKGGAIPIAVRVGAKAPVLESPIDAEIIPVGEGQWDFETWLEAGVSLYPLPAYGVMWLGYRFRTANETTSIDPGDERVFLAELGGTIAGRVGAKMVLDGLFGKNPVVQGILTSESEREIVYLQPAVTYAVTSRLSAEVGARFPIHGKNHPAGNQFQAALFYRRDPPSGN